MTRVVTVTSMALERDSRSFKFAASAARLGYESVVVEGEPSSLLDAELPFELVSPPPQAPDPTAPEPPGPSVLTRITGRLPHPLATPFGHIANFLNKWLLHPVRNSVFSFRASRHYVRARNRETEGLLPDADVYWLHSFLQYPAVRRKVERLGARFLYDTPDAYWEPGYRPAATRQERRVLRAYEAIERRAAKRAERFTTVSDGIAGLLEKRFGRRPEVVRGFHDLRLDRPTESDVRADAGAGTDEFLLVVIGNMKPELNAAEALRALATLPESVQIAFVGRGHEQNRELIGELGLERRVHLLGHVAPTEITSYIRTADAAPVLSRPVTANDRFSLPNKFFHAIAAELPVLYPNLPEMKAIAERYGLGVEIDTADPDSIAAGVTALAGDPEALAGYRENVKAARGELNWEREEKILEAILAPATMPR